MKNYQLTKFLVKKSGVIYGINQYGTQWLEIRFCGHLLKRIDIIQGSDRGNCLSKQDELYMISYIKQLEEEYR